MNKNIVISLVIIVVAVSVMAVFIKNQNDKSMNQQALSLRTQGPTRDQALGIMNPPRVQNLPPSQFACVVTASSNPPVLPSLNLQNVLTGNQQVISMVSITSVGCTPGDAALNYVDLIILPSDPLYMGVDNLTITDITNGASTPQPVRSVSPLSGPVIIATFKLGMDISQNITRTLEVRADVRLNLPQLFPGANFRTVMSNFQTYTSGGPVPVNTAGTLNVQQITL